MKFTLIPIEIIVLSLFEIVIEHLEKGFVFLIKLL